MKLAEFCSSWRKLCLLDAVLAMASPLITFFIFAIILATAVASESSGPVKFSYTGNSTGPEKWGSLDPEFYPCAKGKSQSPVDIPKSEAVLNKNLKPLIRAYHPSNTTLADNLVNIGLHFDENSGALISEGKQYKLKQMHWHTPSEHTIDGIHYDAELHLVHLADDGTYVAVATLYRLGQPDPVIAEIQKELPLLARHVRGYGYHLEVPIGKVDMKELQKRTCKYYKYNGSFTTPPCTETVTWYILGQVRSISEEQIEALKVPLGSGWKNNSRPVQPLNGRQIELYEEFIPPN